MEKNVRARERNDLINYQFVFIILARRGMLIYTNLAHSPGFGL